MELRKLYDPVADLYDVLHREFRHDIPFFVDEARKVKGPVLELAAGTGRVSMELAGAGIETVGLEISAAMLEFARKKLKDLPGDVRKYLTLIQGDMRDFNLGRTFSLISIPARSFQHLQTRIEQEQCLDCVTRHLEPGGRFILSLFAPSYQRLVNKTLMNHLGTIDMPDGRKLTRTEIATHDHVNQLIGVEWTYDMVDSDGNLKRRVWDFKVRYLWRFETELLLEKAGLEVETIYGDYQRGEFNHDGEMLFEARKH